MRARSKTNKVLDIALSEEKFYFPGETIRGSVIVKPKSSMKVNPIILKFSGAVYIAAKDKEVLPLFQTVKSLPINEGKSKILEAKQYSFPFEFVVPKNLPSAMDLGMNKTVRINYKLTAILDRPMMPESLCPKIEYPVLVLEFVDVTKDSYAKPVEKQKEVITSKNRKCHAKLSVPRNGFTRGETIPVNIIVNTFESFVKKESLVIDLIRKVKIQTSRNTLDEEVILKSNKFDLNIIGPYNFTQSITNPILVRSTPPTVRYKDRVLRVHYKIRAQLFIENKKTPNLVLELPIVIGTWPRADVPIDDDDDDDIIQTMGEVMIGDKSDDDDDQWMGQLEEIEFKRHSNHSHTANTSPTSTLAGYYYGAGNNPIRRSGSNNSIGSISSWRSHSTSTDPRNKSSATATSPTSATTTTASTINSMGGNSNYYNSNANATTMIPDNSLLPVGFSVANSGYLNRSSSTPDLLSKPPLQQTISTGSNSSGSGGGNRTRIIDPTYRASYYESASPPQLQFTNNNNNNNSPNNGHRTTKSLHTIHPSYLNFTPVAQQHRRVGSDEFNNSHVSPTYPQQQNDPEVPNQLLTFLSSSPSTPPRIVTRLIQPLEDSESDSDLDDDDDLFSIIEKKKKKEEKEMRRRQRMMYTVNE